MVVRETIDSAAGSVRGGALRIDSNGDLGGERTRTKTGRGGASLPLSSFADLRRSLQRDRAMPEVQNLADLRERLLHGGALSPRELIVLQIRAGEIGLSVELVSKIADGILGVARRFQTPQ